MTPIATPDSVAIHSDVLSEPQEFVLARRRSKVKILHVINDLSIGGAEMMLYRLLSQESRDRFDPVVLSLMDRGSLRQRIEQLGIPVYTARMKPGMANPASVWRLIRRLRQLKPDLIQGWMYHGSLAAQVAALFASSRTPVIWSIHCSIYSLSFEKKLTTAVVRLCAPFSKLASNIVFVSRTSQAQHKDLGYATEHSCVIPNGIDTASFVLSADARLSVRAELNLPQETLLIGAIGRYHPMKDHANFLRAASRVSEAYPDAHFLLAGRGLDAENRALVELIQELKLGDRAHLLGERSDIARLLAALDIFSLSSAHSESFPIIVGEAMSCGVSCVVTDVGDSAWMVGDTGRVAPPRDAEGLAAGWKELISIGLEARESMGKAARSRVTDRFSLSSVVAKYEALYESTTAAKAAEKKSTEPAYQSEVRSQKSEVRRKAATP
jgi:glycosyltransferase involved in cell wall biosynthesis